MSQRSKFYQFFIWWAVIGFSLWAGGTLFSMTVIVPMWSENLPESARTFFSETTFTKHIYNFFGPPWMAARNLPILLALLFAWTSKPHRKYLLITFLTFVFGMAYTIIYVYPINDALMIQAGTGLTDEEVNTLAGKWIFADRLRFAVMLLGYFFLLKAFRLPFKFQKN